MIQLGNALIMEALRRVNTTSKTIKRQMVNGIWLADGTVGADKKKVENME